MSKFPAFLASDPSKQHLMERYKKYAGGMVLKAAEGTYANKRQASIAERTDRFTIQITSKKMLKDAQLFSQDLIGQGYDSYIQKIVFNSEEIWYRVRVGSYDNYNSANTAADALSTEIGMPTWVDFVRKEQ